MANLSNQIADPRKKNYISTYQQALNLCYKVKLCFQIILLEGNIPHVIIRVEVFICCLSLHISLFLATVSWKQNWMWIIIIIWLSTRIVASTLNENIVFAKCLFTKPQARIRFSFWHRWLNVIVSADDVNVCICPNVVHSYEAPDSTD